MAHTTDGLTFDARDRLYFKRALTASSTVAILLVDKTDNTPINVYVSPIVHKGKVLGALFATVQTDAFIMSIDDRLFNGSGQVLVTNNQGHILFRGRGPIPLARYNNIAELIPTGVPPAPGNDIPDTFGSGGLFRYDGSPYYMAHSKLEITSTDWHIFSIVPEDTLTANVGTIQREVLYLMLFFIGLSMVFLWPSCSGCKDGAASPTGQTIPRNGHREHPRRLFPLQQRRKTGIRLHQRRVPQAARTHAGLIQGSLRQPVRQPRPPGRPQTRARLHQQPDQAQRL